VIITADSDQGMVDIHDRRPVVLSAEHPREWIDTETTQERAAQIAKECCQPTWELTWFEVSKDVGNVRNQGPHLIAPNHEENDLFGSR
jgi:putative SOS response-associated peptidase YedK